MVIHYVIGFSLDGVSGMKKATADKIAFLEKRVAKLRVISPQRNKRVPTILAIMQMDVQYVWGLVTGRIERPDVIIARTMLPHTAFLIGKIFNIPILQEVHGDIWDEAKVWFPNNRWKLLMRWLRNRYTVYFLKRSDGLLFNHPLLAQHFKQQYGLKTRYLITFNGANPEAFYPMDVAAVRSELGLARDKKYLVFVGAINPWHGVDYLLETFVHLRKYRDDTDLLIVGNTNSGLGRLLVDKYGSVPGVTFVGQVSPEVARKYINAGTACMLPVRQNRVSPGSPLKLYDYIACGKPVVAQANTMGYSDIVERYGLGLTCDFTSGPVAAKAISHFLDVMDPDYYARHNRELAEGELSWATVMEKWVRFAEETLHARSL